MDQRTLASLEGQKRGDSAGAERLARTQWVRGRYSVLPLILGGVVACRGADEPSEETTGLSQPMHVIYDHNKSDSGLPIGDPFFSSAGFAGAMRWNNNGTSAQDPAACRNCSVTGVSPTPPSPPDDLGPGLRGHEKSRKDNQSLDATFGASATATSDLHTYADSLWDFGTSLSGGPAGGLKRLMRQARTPARAAFNKTGAGSYGSKFLESAQKIKELIEAFTPAAGHVQINTGSTPKYWSIAFKPIQSKFKSSITTTGPGGLVTTHYNPQPQDLAEVRLRGARSYCAMRECSRKQRSMDRLPEEHGEVHRR